MKKQSKTVEIIVLKKKNNAKARNYKRFGEILKRKDAQHALNQALKKAFWRHENPRQKLLDFRQQIAIYANLFTESKKDRKNKN